MYFAEPKYFELYLYLRKYFEEPKYFVEGGQFFKVELGRNFDPGRILCLKAG
jgi:hypothetical protein